MQKAAKVKEVVFRKIYINWACLIINEIIFIDIRKSYYVTESIHVLTHWIVLYYRYFNVFLSLFLRA